MLRRRVDQLGVAEPTLQRAGDRRVIVELPGVDDPQQAVEVIGRTAQLTFHQVADLGRTWTFEITNGGREVSRQTITGEELAGRDWTIRVPAAATADLERQGSR